MAKLVAYFSRSGSNWVNDSIKEINIGNTEILAQYIAKQTNADIFKIQTKTVYINDYRKCKEQAKEELELNLRPEILNCPENLDKYDTIYIGHPIWFGTFPTAIFSFLEKFNCENKIIYPFCTHEGGDISNSIRDMKNICKNTTIKDYFETRGYKCQEFDKYNLDKEINN